MQLLHFFQAVLFAVFLWWFVTGLIVIVYGRSGRVKHLFFAGATGVMLLAIGGLVLTRHQTQVSAVYLALMCGLLIWGWQVTGYYLGYITGPHTEEDLQEALPAFARGRSSFSLRFWHALRASLFHELLIVGFIILISGLTWNAPNKWGLWLFLVLWAMHSLAKINVFLGVRNFNIKFLPDHLHYLDHLLPKRATNRLLPVTVVIGSIVALIHFYRGLTPGTTAAQTVGFTVIGAMITLGVIEHLLLIAPIRAILWGWGVKILPRQADPSQADPSHKRCAALRTIPEQAAEG